MKPIEKIIEEMGINITPNAAMTELIRNLVGFELKIKTSFGKEKTGIIIGTEQKNVNKRAS